MLITLCCLTNCFSTYHAACHVLFVFLCCEMTFGVKCPLTSHACHRHVKGRVFVALANGTVAIFHRSAGRLITLTVTFSTGCVPLVPVCIAGGKCWVGIAGLGLWFGVMVVMLSISLVFCCFILLVVFPCLMLFSTGSTSVGCFICHILLVVIPGHRLFFYWSNSAGCFICLILLVVFLITDCRLFFPDDMLLVVLLAIHCQMFTCPHIASCFIAISCWLFDCHILLVVSLVYFDGCFTLCILCSALMVTYCSFVGHMLLFVLLTIYRCLYCWSYTVVCIVGHILLFVLLAIYCCLYC